MLISIEGVDGSGKNTVADGVAKHFEALRLDFPYEEGSPTGQAARAYLRGDWNTLDSCYNPGDFHLGDLLLQSLLTVNKYECLDLLRRHAGIHNPRHLVLARYIPSALVYGTLDGLDRAWLEAIHAGLPAADVNLLVDVDAEIAMQRIHSRGEPVDVYEQWDRVERAVEVYRELWHEKQRQPHAVRRASWYTVDGSFAIEEVVLLATECVRWELSDAR